MIFDLNDTGRTQTRFPCPDLWLGQFFIDCKDRLRELL